MDVERWDIYEAELKGPRDGNPFTEVRISAVFRNEHREVAVDGFYDGDGVYRVRFMPEEEGEWTFETRSNRDELRGATGAFACTQARGNNHADLSCVVRTRMFVTDISRWQEFGQAHGEAFGAHPPATTMVEVAGLIDPDMLIEIEAEAVVAE